MNSEQHYFTAPYTRIALSVSAHNPICRLSSYTLPRKASNSHRRSPPCCPWGEWGWSARPASPREYVCI